MLPPVKWSGLLFFFLSAVAVHAGAQQPFLTDDAEVTPERQWHFEISNEYVVLSRSASPDLRQDTSNFVVQYGLFKGFEINVDLPLISIERTRDSPIGSAFGLGDVDFVFKLKLLAENPNGIRPAFTLTGAVELPTGNASNQLGSGFTDYSFNSVVQKTFSETTVVHVNAGIQLSGNAATGAIGIRTPGRILTAGVSVAHDISRTLRLGVDLNGAQIRDAQTIQRQLQVTVGGNYQVKEKSFARLRPAGGLVQQPPRGVAPGRLDLTVTGTANDAAFRRRLHFSPSTT